MNNNHHQHSRLSMKRLYFVKPGEIIVPNIGPHRDPSHTFYYRNFEIIQTKENKPKVIGTGAYGNVYLSQNISDSKYYAIKQVKKQSILNSGASLDIMYREIKIHLTLVHPNIVRLFSYHEDKDNFSLIMEYLNKGTLFTYIRQKKKLSENESFDFFIQILNAIYFLHLNNYIHRDIKPENILLDDNLNVKLCDFGWCVEVECGQRSTFCGTYEYMAPEIVKDEPYDHSIDIWSIGVLLYEMTHGYSPFRAKEANGEEYKEIFRNIIKVRYEIDSSLGLSEECVDMIEKLLENEPQKRLSVKQVFNHPWVKKYEQIKKKEAISKVKEVNDNGVDNNNSNYQEMNDLLGKLEKLNQPKKNKKKRTASQAPKTKQGNKNIEGVFNNNNESNFNIKTNKHNQSNQNINQKEYNVLLTDNSVNQNKSSKYNDKYGLNNNKQIDIIIDNDFDDNNKNDYYLRSEYNKDNMMDSIRILENAEKVREDAKNKKKENQPEESFWDKLIKPFKCGND